MRLTTILLALDFLALSAIAQAVVPPPDGGYAGGNTAEGQAALLSLTNGTYNTAVGFASLRALTDGSFCTGVGAGTLLLNTANDNTATGTGALLSNSTGEGNTANGTFALFNNTTASGNTAIGSNALLSNTTGGTLGTTQNLDVGPNTAVGASALASNTTASANTAVGYRALGSNTTGRQDTDVGLSTAVGFQALANASGPSAAVNDGFGYQALFNLTDGQDNVAIGVRTLFATTNGNGNVALGTLAGSSITTGDGNICIGAAAAFGITNASNVIAIGAAGANVDNSCYIGNIFNKTSSGGTAVFINSDGKLGTTTSSRRFKEEIKPMERASEVLFALKPVTFRYKKEIDPTGTSQLGLVAEEVETVDPDLVVRDKNGEIYTVRYDAVNAMLLNEFLKEHKKVRDLEATVVQQQKGMDILTAQLKEQAAQIQKVSAQLEVNKPAPHVVVNKP